MPELTADDGTANSINEKVYEAKLKLYLTYSSHKLREILVNYCSNNGSVHICKPDT